MNNTIRHNDSFDEIKYPVPEFPVNANFVVYKFLWPTTVMIKLLDTEKSWKSIKEKAKPGMYGFSLRETENGKDLPGLYIIDGKVGSISNLTPKQTTYNLPTEATRALHAANKLNAEKILKSDVGLKAEEMLKNSLYTKYVKTRLANVFLAFDEKNMKII